MLGDVHVPLGEKDGNLVFLSEKLRDIEQERGAIALRTVDVKRIFNDALRESFDPLPRVSLHGTMAVATGLKVQAGSAITSLAGDQSTIQTVVELVPASDYEAAKNRMLDDSRSRAGRNIIGLLARSNPELDDLANEIYRCQRIAELHRNEPDQEVKDYCTGQLDRAAKLATQLQSKIKQTLQAGSFVFRGQATAVSALDADLLEAAKKLLSDVADQVFDRYVEAPVRAGTDTAEKFLKVANPAAISSSLDPLGLVQTVAGRASFKTDHKAMISIRDYIDKRGTVDGKRLLDDFSSDPFGWSPDTTRYIVAAMLMAGEIKLKVSGREVTAAGQQAIDALKTNNSFKQIGVALRDERPSIETLGRAAERLTELVGDMVIPLEQEISKAAAKHFPRFQHDYGSLAEKLSGLGLAGSDRIRTLNQDIADVLFTDASDAPQRLGAETSAIYDNLKWALEVKRVLDNGLDATLRDLQAHRRDIEALPDTGVPGELRRELAEDLGTLSERLGKEDFYKHTADFNSQLTHLKGRVRDAVITLSDQQKLRLKEGVEDLQRIPEWEELTQEERGNAVNRLDGLALAATQDLAGLKKLLARDYDINSTLEDLKRSIQRQGQERLRQRMEEERAKTGEKGPAKLTKSISVPVKMTSAADIDALIQQLHEIKAQLGLYAEIEVTISKWPSTKQQETACSASSTTRAACWRRSSPASSRTTTAWTRTAGAVAELASLRHINDAQRESARILRDTLAHYCASGDMDAKQGLDRIVREQAFTVLNRLAALRMAEARGLLVESVGNGFQAKGFQLYARLAGTGLGETGDAYRTYLFSVFDELSQDLPGLFDRYSPQGRLFPREAALLQVLNLINDADIAPLWSEDETIGWIYQYFNSKEERKAMRDASQAPRNSRELAVRNQFFTPRYVVEFLVDNTLGRLWFNATGGDTHLRERCQYLLVKPDEAPQAATKLRDPRTLKLLDPACGSMHFGLYAFDLFAEIYREAWAWEQQHGPGSLDVSTQPQAALKPLSQTYRRGGISARCAAPDHRAQHLRRGHRPARRADRLAGAVAAGAARLARCGVKAKDRPLIGRGHVVAAIAPPAERELRQQFAAKPGSARCRAV
jgi:hypothetical protein